MAKEKLLVDPDSKEAAAKRVIVSDRPDEFRPSLSKIGQEILWKLAEGPKYPAEIARILRVHHQTVYYHIGRLEKAGLIDRVRKESIRGGEANLYSLSSDGFAVEYPVPGEALGDPFHSARSNSLGRFFAEFLREGRFDGWVVVGSPMQHGSGGTQARDGHYAVQLGFALGQFVSLPSIFPVKLDV